MQQQSTPYSNVSPLLFIGMFLFVAPFFNGIGKISIPSWIGYVGIGVLVIGVGHTIYMRV